MSILIAALAMVVTLPHVAQIAGGLAFIYAVGTRVDVRLRRAAA